jgi:hypothetical protein
MQKRHDQRARALRAVGQIILGAAIAGAAAGLASFALYEGLDVISSDASVDMSLVSPGAAAIAAILGFPLRNRLRSARDGMFVGLATLGGWFLLLVYALGQDTP